MRQKHIYNKYYKSHHIQQLLFFHLKEYLITGLLDKIFIKSDWLQSVYPMLIKCVHEHFYINLATGGSLTLLMDF